MYFAIIVCVSMKIRKNWRKEVTRLPAPARYAGFTLIELSIVLVVIGLLVGGVLVGHDLVEAAKIRSKLGKFQQIEMAYNTFRTKYNCMAGDCRNADQLGLGPNGNGNRTLFNGGSDDCTYYIGSNWEHRNLAGECQAFWVHLSKAGLIEAGLRDLTPADFSGGSGGTVFGDVMSEYFPKLDKGYLSILEINGDLYIRTGLYFTTSAAYQYANFPISEVSGAEMQSIVGKYGIIELCDTGSREYTGCESVLGKKIIPIGTVPYSETNARPYFVGLNGSWGADSCYAGGQWQEDGPCNLLFRIN